MPVGFVIYCVYDVPPLKQKIGLFHLLGISKDHKRKGYGLLLAQKALEAIKKEKPDYVMLAVKVANKPARALYEKLGFKLMFPVMNGIQDTMYKLEL